MWKCSACQKENTDDKIKCSCGFDRSLDYVNFSVVTKLNQSDKNKYEKQCNIVQTPVTAVKKVEKPVEPIKNTAQPKEIKPVINVESKVAKPVQQNPQPKTASNSQVHTGTKSFEQKPQANVEKKVEVSSSKTTVKTKNTVVEKQSLFPKTLNQQYILLIGVLLIAAFLLNVGGDDYIFSYPLIEMNGMKQWIYVGLDWIFLYGLYSFLWDKMVLRVMVCIILGALPVVISMQCLFGYLGMMLHELFGSISPGILVRIMIPVTWGLLVLGAMVDEEGNLFEKH